MKRLYFIFAIALMLASCAEQDAGLLKQSVQPLEEQLDDVIDLDEAIVLSKKFRNGVGYSRSFFDEIDNVEYVVRKQSRSNDDNDTLAYILNYAHDNGFAIIASRNIASPILAFSDNGSFDLSNENAKVSFVDRIEDYLDNSISLPGRPTLPEIELTPIGVVPFSKMKLSQKAPWNKYVAEEHFTNKMPVGCVAVATATVMAYSKPELTYHDVTYDLKSMVKTIEKNAAGLPVDYDSLSSARDSMAKILYWIGKDVHMDYDVSGSGAFSEDAASLLDSLGFSMSHRRDYLMSEVINFLDSKHIVYLRGSGHAFISDGYTLLERKDTDNSNNQNATNTILPPDGSSPLIPITLYPHISCDWGWGGLGNGYFYGEVFEPFPNEEYRPVHFWAIRLEY